MVKGREGCRAQARRGRIKITQCIGNPKLQASWLLHLPVWRLPVRSTASPNLGKQISIHMHASNTRLSFVSSP